VNESAGARLIELAGVTKVYGGAVPVEARHCAASISSFTTVSSSP